MNPMESTAPRPFVAIFGLRAVFAGGIIRRVVTASIWVACLTMIGASCAWAVASAIDASQPPFDVRLIAAVIATGGLLWSIFSLERSSAAIAEVFIDAAWNPD